MVAGGRWPGPDGQGGQGSWWEGVSGWGPDVLQVPGGGPSGGLGMRTREGDTRLQQPRGPVNAAGLPAKTQFTQEPVLRKFRGGRCGT